MVGVRLHNQASLSSIFAVLLRRMGHFRQLGFLSLSAHSGPCPLLTSGVRQNHRCSLHVQSQLETLSGLLHRNVNAMSPGTVRWSFSSV